MFLCFIYTLAISHPRRRKHSPQASFPPIHGDQIGLLIIHKRVSTAIVVLKVTLECSIIPVDKTSETKFRASERTARERERAGRGGEELASPPVFPVNSYVVFSGCFLLYAAGIALRTWEPRHVLQDDSCMIGLPMKALAEVLAERESNAPSW